MTHPLIGTSWKMNLTPSEANAWFRTFVPLVADLADGELFVLPPFPAIPIARDRLRDTRIAWGAQDVHPDDAGAHTGDVSAPMLADLGCRFVEIGHSERRRDHGETPQLIAAKVAAVLRWGMIPILCVGEAVDGPIDVVAPEVVADLEACLADVAAPDVGRMVVAYEPAWAIGEGRVAAPAERVGAIQRTLGDWLQERAGGLRPRILYGGSVDEAAAVRLLREPGVDGLFVGRFALDPERFARIARARAVAEEGRPG
jgi:triosephosphate isomerase (TIM)